MGSVLKYLSYAEDDLFACKSAMIYIRQAYVCYVGQLLFKGNYLQQPNYSYWKEKVTSYLKIVTL